jgi:uncharacterized protein YktB (UPF0637 family)
MPCIKKNVSTERGKKIYMFTGFEEKDFEVFQIDGLEARMEGIRGRIQPKFKAIGEKLLSEVSMLLGEEMFVHIARHARRKVNAPIDTWMAFSPNKRGYKMYPHFQIGLFDDRVFIWLAFIYEVENKEAIAERLLQNIGRIQSALTSDALVSFDHMKKDAVSAAGLGVSEWEAAIVKFQSVKNAELLLGTVIEKNDPALRDGERFLALTMDWISRLADIYRIALPR